MTMNPTMELSGRTSASCDKGNALESLKVQMPAFEVRLAEYRRAETAWNDAIGTNEEEARVGVLRELFLRLLAFPCLSPEMLAYKAAAILSDTDMTEWLGNDEEAVRVLLSTHLCMKADDRGHLPASHVAVDAGALATNLTEKIATALDLLRVLMPQNTAAPQVDDLHVVSELVSGAVIILSEVAQAMPVLDRSGHLAGRGV